MIQAGQSFIPPGATGDTDHLFVILTEWDEEGESVTVNVTDYENVYEPVIDIPAGTPLTPTFTTTKRSTINYAKARKVPSSRIDELLSRGAVQNRGQCDPQWLDKIREELFASPDTPNEILDYCEAFDWGL